MSSRRGMGSAGATLRRPAVEARPADGDPSLVSALAGPLNEAGQAADGVGYVPSEWEKGQLARIDEVSDSDGIACAEGP